MNQHQQDSSQLQPPNKPKLILDTNIPSYLLRKETTEQINEILDTLVPDYEICTSRLSTYELLKKGTSDVQSVIVFFRLSVCPNPNPNQVRTLAGLKHRKFVLSPIKFVLSLVS